MLRSPALVGLLLCSCSAGEISLLEPPPALNAPDAAGGSGGAPDATGGSGGATGGSAGAPMDGGGRCTSRDECTSGGRPFCSADSGRCVECTNDLECESGRVCNPLTEECDDRCDNADDCTSGERPVCDVANHVCAECVSGSPCTLERPLCLAGSCVECVTGDDCKDPSDPICADDHRCRH